MITVSRYLLRRLFLYFILLSSALTLIYNFVEFVEKIKRLTDTHTSSIATFIVLNLGPTFFELISLATWIAMCFLLWELHQLGEWETFNIISISPRRILRVLCIGGLALSFFSFIGKEVIVHRIKQKAEHYRLSRFKGHVKNILFNQWIMPTPRTMIHVDMLDFAHKNGKNIIIITVDDEFNAQEKLHAPTFSIHTHDKTITLHNASRYRFTDAQLEHVEQITQAIPSLFVHLKMLQSFPSLWQQLGNIVRARSLSSYYPFNQELGKFLARLLAHLKPLLLCMLTFCLFYVIPHPQLRWVAVLIVYPSLVVLTSLADFLLSHNAPFVVIFIPYLLILGIILYALRFLR